MSIQEARRVGFEKWHKVCLERCPGQDYYDSDWTDTAWVAWNAALDSVVVKLPNIKNLEIVGIGCTYEDSFIDYLDTVRSIEEAGIRCEEEL